LLTIINFYMFIKHTQKLLSIFDIWRVSWNDTLNNLFIIFSKKSFGKHVRFLNLSIF
jgi:hypothetical protein